MVLCPIMPFSDLKKGFILEVRANTAILPFQTGNNQVNYQIICYISFALRLKNALLFFLRHHFCKEADVRAERA